MQNNPSQPPEELNLDVVTKGRTIGHERGYAYVLVPGHPLASNLYGKVYLHRYVASVTLGRWLRHGEIVRFRDGDKTNLSPDNLDVMSRSEHSLRNFHTGKLAPRPKETLVCQHCGAEFVEIASHASRRKYCSKACAIKARRKFEIPPEELEDLVWKHPMSTLSKMFGVSDKAIKKRCQRLGIETPGRGYWRKLETGQIDPSVAKLIRQQNRQRLQK